MSEETEEPLGGGFRLWMLLPALGAAAVVGVFMLGLQREDGGLILPSTLLGKTVPEFEMAPLYEGQPGFSTADLKAPGVKLVNVWASWCVPCRAEHKNLVTIADSGIPIYGINYKDTEEGAKGFLEELGNPFTLVGTDTKGRIAIEWGVYGIPESFVVDGQGRIVYKKIGMILESDIESKIMPAIEKARAGG